ncbi:AGAP011813-PA-like protein [Anopheles sinensis]|uniref:AGAP011813-PA-like protein n=1 Tax=Anopheles sinensis TaxID=74873 RepID=A0A084WJ80_ANOSI|nr:AGAP011813-PA-like protein [Anopheles sinensis]
MLIFVDRLRIHLGRRLEKRAASVREQYFYIVRILNVMGGLVGGDIFTPNFTAKNWYFKFVLFNIALVFSINLFSLYKVYGSLVDFMYCLETILYVGICSVKLYTFVWHKDLILKLHQFIITFMDNFGGSKEEDEHISQTVHNIYALLVLFACCSCGAAGLIFVYSLLWSALVEYVVPFGFVIPSVSIDNLRGFSVNYALQLFESILTVSGIVGSECAFFMFLLNACLQVDMMCLELDRLSALCVLNGKGQYTVEIRNRIRTIIEHHIEHLDFMKTMCNLFMLHFLVVFGCIFFQLISIVVVVVAIPNWYPGYFLFTMLTFQLFFSCALGQLLDLKCDELTVAIYTVPWYNMEVQDQKALRLLLMASQRPVLISYGFGTVNIRTFFEIYRKTYSIGMMMIGVNEEN